MTCLLIFLKVSLMSRKVCFTSRSSPEWKVRIAILAFGAVLSASLFMKVVM